LVADLEQQLATARASDRKDALQYWTLVAFLVFSGVALAYGAAKLLCHPGPVLYAS
jgi:hypothetical protein